MPLGTQCQIWFGVVWFGAKFFDYLIPPSDPTFNAALALSACIASLANGLDKHRGWS